MTNLGPGRYVELTLIPSRDNLRHIRLNAKQLRIYRSCTCTRCFTKTPKSEISSTDCEVRYQIRCLINYSVKL